MNAIKLACSIILLCSFSAAGCKKDTVAPQPVSIKSPLTQRILDSTRLIATVFSDTVFQVSEGVEETDIHYLNAQGYTMHVFILKVDTKHPDIKLEAAMPYGLDTYALQTVPEMAKYEDAPNHRVLAGVNADFFATSGEPRGILVRNGVVLKTTWYNARSQTFLAVLKNGKTYIGDRADFVAMQDQLDDALGGGPMLVKDKQVMPQTDVSVEPRTGAGLSDDGILYFVVADGRNFYYSNGMSLPDLGALLKACGASKAINIDGGGSSTFMIRHPLANVWQVRNKPSDGSNRAVGNAWMVVGKRP